MRAIDADALEKDGWMMHRIVQVDEKTMSYQTKKPTDFPTIEPEPKWIPCSERPPEEKDAGKILKKIGKNKRSDHVIATVDVKGERMTVTACTYDGVWDWEMKYAFPEYEIVAWMPLPEPYRGGEQDGRNHINT